MKRNEDTNDIEMNESVIHRVEQYVKDINPQYAILLSGTWGCGKTHFIDSWIEQYRKEQEVSESKKKKSCRKRSEIMLKPVKVSLFGLQTIAELIEAINRELSPIVFKLKKYGLVAAKVISKIALQTDVFGGKDSPIEVEVSALDTLFPGNEEVSIKGEKVIVLDDVERCKIPLTELFGFIDLLLHKYQYKVIIVGDEKRFDGEDKGRKIYSQYKEKIIGQTFVVQKDSNAAFSAFVEEIEKISIEASKFTKENRVCVLDVFEASGYSNLRTLKQALHLYAFLFMQLNKGADDYKLEILANYVAISMELHNNQLYDLGQIFQNLQFGLNKEDVATRIYNKYQFIEKTYNVRLFKGYDFIYHALKDGYDISTTINDEIERRNNQPLSIQYKDYSIMSNDEFELKTESVYNYLKEDVQNLYEYLILLYLYCKVQYEELIPKNEEFINECTDKCITFLLKITNLNEFFLEDAHVRIVLSSISYEPSISLFENVSEKLKEIISKQKIALKDNLANVMENLSDKSIEQFKDLIKGPDPYNEANYSLLPIFDKIDIDAFVRGYLSLSNRNKNIVCVYIGDRYEHLQNSQGLRARIVADKDYLKKIIEKLQQEEKGLVSIDRLQVNKFITMMENAIIELQKPDIRY